MSSFKQGNFNVGKKAGADLSADQHKFGDYDSNGDIVLAGAGAGKGVIMSASNDGDFVEFAMTGGGALVEAQEAISVGDEIASDANGLAVVAAAGDIVLGIAESDAVDGDIFPIFCTLHYKHA